jgi:hypothetical protein
MSDLQPDTVNIECTIPVEWLSQLQAIALTTKVAPTQLVVDAIGLYLSRRVYVAPTMAAGLSYEELENEPDEILWDFLPSDGRSDAPETYSSNRVYQDDLGDDMDEILTDFLEPS